MDIRSTRAENVKTYGWAARLPVKISCIILIPIMAFIASFGAIGIMTGLNGVNINDRELLFSDFKNNNFFYESFMHNAIYVTRSLFWLRDEEYINNMGLLEWRYDAEAEMVVNGQVTDKGLYNLVSTYKYAYWTMGPVWASDMDGEEAERVIKEAVSSQLYTLYIARSWLEDIPGLVFFITDGEHSLGNAPEGAGAEFFKSHPVYWIEGIKGESGNSRENIAGYRAPTQYKRYDDFINGTEASGLISYIAFTESAVSAYNSQWSELQAYLIGQIVLLIAPVLAAMALLIILMTGAGRKHGHAGGDVHYTALDKPWLDVGLVFTALYEIGAGVMFYNIMQTAWRYANTNSMILVSALISISMPLPVAWWFISFSKRCKAGAAGRHTFCYVLLNRARKVAMLLWAGVPLTAKSLAAGGTVFLGALFCAVYPSAQARLGAGILFTVAFTLLLLRYSHKLNMVAKGAKAAGAGQGFDPIAVFNGELGSIAMSVNNMTDGINAAVAERMKSERLKTELITNVSHDIRTPLTSLITYADLLKTEGLGCDRAPEYLDVLISKSARLKALTDDLFEAAKAVSGNIDTHITDMDLADFMRQALGEMNERIDGSGLDFRISLPERAPVKADGKLLWRVMENLMSNVLKYALKGSRVYIGVEPEGGWQKMEMKNVSESPLNVDPSELTERFKRGDEARGGDGSGLGLSIAQSFIQLQGGQFELSIDGDLFKATIRLPG